MAKGLTKAQRDLTFLYREAEHTNSAAYIDIGQSLSIVNRKLFSQKKVYGVESLRYSFGSTYTGVEPDVDLVYARIRTAGDTWSVHNAWVKGHALHTEMQALVLDDNPSIKGTWAEYKVFLDSAHRNANVGALPVGNLKPIDGSGAFVLEGSWDYSIFVMPQHDVDLVTGEPLPADETYVHLLGPNLGDPLTNTLLSAGLVEAYSKSRATVQPQDPAVPAGMSDSFFNLLTDSGSQEPELALVIETENDNPPYDQTSYPGGGVNAGVPWITKFDIANSAQPNGMMDGFLTQCGLLEVVFIGYKNGEVVPLPDIVFNLTLAPGMYKGVAAIDMGQ
jgi:hypothetical protein